MDYSHNLKKFGSSPSEEQIAKTVADMRVLASQNHTKEVYTRCFSCLDLTSLNGTDSHSRIEQFVRQVIELPDHFPSVPVPASVCVYPIFVETAGLAIGEQGLSITSVAGGFPASQTYIEVKILEAAMAVENGADEIDVVLNVGELLDGQYDLAGNEIETIREEIGEQTILKVILESGVLQTPEQIWRASLIAMLGGADFIKTSTGKMGPGATPEAAVVMCRAIEAFRTATGRNVGLKVAGGVTKLEDAVLYYTSAKELLCNPSITRDNFRIGASSLANALLSAIEQHPVNYF